MLKTIMGVLIIVASFLSGSTKQLTIAAAHAEESKDCGGSRNDRGATCG